MQEHACERKDGASGVPPMRSGDLIRLPCFPCAAGSGLYRNRSLPICRQPLLHLFLLSRFLLRKVRPAHANYPDDSQDTLVKQPTNTSRRLHRGSSTATLCCMQILCNCESSWVLGSCTQHTALAYAEQSNNTRPRLTAIRTRRQLTSGFPRIGQTDLTTSQLSSFPKSGGATPCVTGLFARIGEDMDWPAGAVGLPAGRTTDRDHEVLAAYFCWRRSSTRFFLASLF